MLVPSGGTSSGKVSWGCAFYCQSCRREYVNYWANFWPAFVKNCWGPPFAVWCVLAKLGHSVYSACKNFTAQQELKYGFSKKSIWESPNSHTKLFLPNAWGIAVKNLVDFRCVYSFRRYLRSKFEDVQDRIKFYMSLAFLEPLNFWTCIIKPNQIMIMWPMELGDLTLNKKIHLR